MRQTPNYDLNLFDATDEIEDDSRLAFNTNFGIIDAALKDASENGGIAVQDTQPTNDVLAWVDSDAQGADFCFVGDTAPATDGTVAVWVDTSEDEIPVQSGAGGVSYDNTDSGLTADNVQGAIDEITADFIVDQGTDGIWTYRKWNSGVAECWGTQAESVTFTEQYKVGTIYYYAMSQLTFPTGLFNAVPIALTQDNSANNILVSPFGTTQTGVRPRCFFISPSASTVSVKCGIRVIGTWK